MNWSAAEIKYFSVERLLFIDFCFRQVGSSV